MNTIRAFILNFSRNIMNRKFASSFSRLFACSAIMVCLGGPVWAQEDFQLWLNPRLNDFQFQGELNGAFYDEEDVEDQKEELEASRYSGRLQLKVGGTENSEWLAELGVKGRSLNTDAVFDESGRDLPDDLADIYLGLTYRRFLDNDWLLGQNLRFGSASDEPFDSIEEMYLEGTTFLRIPSGRSNAWLLFLNFDTNRQIPVLPGAAFQYTLAENLATIFGVPIAAVFWKPDETTSLDIIYFPVKNLSATIRYKPVERWTFSLGYKWDQEFYQREDRDEWDDRIELEEQHVKLTAAYQVTDKVSFAVNGGYAFSRHLGEGNDYDDISNNDIDIEDGWFAGTQVKFRY